jgi:hypothetical protein
MGLGRHVAPESDLQLIQSLLPECTPNCSKTSKAKQKLSPKQKHLQQGKRNEHPAAVQMFTNHKQSNTYPASYTTALQGVSVSGPASRKSVHVKDTCKQNIATTCKHARNARIHTFNESQVPVATVL